MNKIAIKNHFVPSGYEMEVFFIDDVPLYEYITKWTGLKPELSQSIADDLAICWTDEYDFEGDARFMRFVLGKERAIIPILSCPEDFDFSCTVIVADIEKQRDKVLWKRIGIVDHSAESFEEEKRRGILFTQAYSEEDWVRYGGDIASEEVDSPAWSKWMSDNWSEELFRRRVNYTYPYYQDERNIIWIAGCGFEFDRREYDALVAGCYAGVDG